MILSPFLSSSFRLGRSSPSSPIGMSWMAAGSWAWGLSTRSCAEILAWVAPCRPTAFWPCGRSSMKPFLSRASAIPCTSSPALSSCTYYQHAVGVFLWNVTMSTRLRSVVPSWRSWPSSRLEVGSTRCAWIAGAGPRRKNSREWRWLLASAGHCQPVAHDLLVQFAGSSSPAEQRPSLTCANQPKRIVAHILAIPYSRA